MENSNKIKELLEMCYYGHIDQVKELIQGGVKLNSVGENGMTPLFAAVNGENYDIVNYLIDSGADVNFGDWTVLHETFDLIIDGMIQDNLDKPDESIIEILRLLIENGADPTKRSSEGKTPLDLIKTYSANINTYNKLVGIFRPIINNIDNLIEK